MASDNTPRNTSRNDWRTGKWTHACVQPRRVSGSPPMRCLRASNGGLGTSAAAVVQRPRLLVVRQRLVVVGGGPWAFTVVGSGQLW